MANCDANTRWRWLALALLLNLLPAAAERVSDVRNTRHNLSANAPAENTVRASTETQVCVFCHTPHHATNRDVQGQPVNTPLWNRKLSGATYTLYNSTSLDAVAIQSALDQPGGSSKLCLSCHDGTLAIGNVNVLNNQGSATEPGTVAIGMTGTGAGGVMPPGEGTTTGFTRSLGVDLTNDHPISLNFTAPLAARDGELRPVDGNQKWPPAIGTVIGVRGPGYKPQMSLEPTGSGGVGQVQCATCHDPHLRETNSAVGSQKFLRTNRFQEGNPGVNHNAATDQICLSCHDKNMAVGAWAFSAHANPLVATQTYKLDAAQRRQFPNTSVAGQSNLPVWKAACLNCHDTHTVQGAKRLLREGTDSTTVPKAGGAAATEEVCYQCHRDAAGSVITPSTTVPDIRSDFQLPRRMPISNIDQGGAAEPHDIGGAFNDVGFVDCTSPTNRCGADGIESRARLGVNNLGNRHAECTDCHNPHRVVKFRDFRGNPVGSLAGSPDPAGTHRHDDAAGYTHTNIASGVLRGTFGVEPIYGSASFFALPTSYQVKRGDPGADTNTNALTAPYVTREYQICLKCHSDYGYSDNNVYPNGDRPSLGSPGTPAGTNGMSQYTNQAREFQSPLTHQGQPGSTGDSGAASLYSANNHRSWHPALRETGRTATMRGDGASIANNWRLPWRNAVGAQTMYCSDCHGSNVASATSVIPNGGENGSPWGPHGSTNNFILKGLWNTSTGSGQETNGLCFKCHDPNIYAPTSGGGARTGFWIASDQGSGKDGHYIHSERDKLNNTRCNWCHVAVPHGWKNKAFLVNLNDVGPEAGQTAGTEVRRNTSTAYNQGPYYMNAMLKVRQFKPSGQWVHTDCGSRGGANGGNGLAGREWMREGSEACTNPP